MSRKPAAKVVMPFGRDKKKKATPLGYVLFYVIIIAIWQAVWYVGTMVFDIWKPYAFPNPKGVFISLLQQSQGGDLLRAIGFSLERAAIGFAVAIVCGVILGLLIMNIGVLARYLKPMILGIQTLPSICWVPFAILWFGLTAQAIIFVVVMGSMFSIALSVESSVRNINPIYVKAARTMGASGKNLILHVIFPAALPNFIAGLRQGWSFGWRALMAGEVMSAAIGLGHSLVMGRDLADINQVMLIMIIIVIVGIVIDKFVFSLIEEKVLRKRGL